MSDFDGRSSFGTWLFRITRNTCIDMKRRARVEKRDYLRIKEDCMVFPASPFQSPDHGLINQEASVTQHVALAMKYALSKLTDVHREILFLREVKSLSYVEISEKLGIPEGTVMSRLYHARKKMINHAKDFLCNNAGTRS